MVRLTILASLAIWLLLTTKIAVAENFSALHNMVDMLWTTDQYSCSNIDLLKAVVSGQCKIKREYAEEQRACERSIKAKIETLKNHDCSDWG